MIEFLCKADKEELQKAIDNVQAGEVTDERLQNSVESYFEKNPVQDTNPLPEVTEEDNGKVLMVVGGEWTVSEPDLSEVAALIGGDA